MLKTLFGAVVLPSTALGADWGISQVCATCLKPKIKLSRPWERPIHDIQWAIYIVEIN